MRRSPPFVVAGLALALAGLAACGSQPPGPPPEPAPLAAVADARLHPNLPMPTLGGRQVWADVAWRQGWRVQQNVLTGHFRLLDDGDVRRAWGGEAACRAELERAARAHDLAPRSQRLVVLLHGLFRSRHCFDALQQALVARGYDVAALGYPSTQYSIEESAEQLACLLAELDGYDEIDVVTHSLGGLVARALLAPPAGARAPGAPRFGRLVMLAPPNQGAALAGSLQGLSLFELVAGPAGATVASSAARELPIPRVPFGIVAGGRGDDAGYNPLLEGDDDGVVCVAETQLDGAADFVVVRGMHTFLMQHDEVVRATLCFLEHGRFAAR